MKYLSRFNELNIKSICEKYGIENYTINNGLVDVDGDVDLNNNKLTKIPIKFGKVSGDFNCYDNLLTSLEGSPESVGGNFYCYKNKLTSLEGSPKRVGGYFNCGYNKLTSLEGSPERVGGYFYCNNNPISVIWNLFNDKSLIELFNYFDPIRPPEVEGEQPIIYLIILNAFLKEIGKPPVTKINGYKFI